MSRLVCKGCGVNDYIVYIIRPEGTFCVSCNEKLEQDMEGAVTMPGMKDAPLESITHAP